MISELFRALYAGGLPMFLLTFALVWWALHRGRLKGESSKDLEQSIAALVKLRKTQKKEKKKPEKLDPVLEKWFRFGGGFYGLVAFYTWLIIESKDVANFFRDLGDIIIRFDLGAVIGLVISLLIESLMNFITAIAWPAYWLTDGRSSAFWVLAAFGGYQLGKQAAQRAAGKRWLGESPDPGEPPGDLKSDSDA